MSQSQQQAELFLRNIPENLQKDIIYHCHVFVGKRIHYDIALTQGPILYETRNRQILSSCNLSKTILGGMSNWTDASFIMLSYPQMLQNFIHTFQEPIPLSLAVICTEMQILSWRCDFPATKMLRRYSTCYK